MTTTTEPLPAVHPATARLPYEPQSARAARRLVRDKLTQWELADLVDDALVIVSELVSNAAKTGCHQEMVVAIRRITERTVRISVRDGSRALPVMVTAGLADTSGRGLALVHKLTGGHWGATPEPRGKTVHADLRVSQPAT
ncbi:ATP-binding protein [Kitasatospora sp. NPDC048365]|uniref:ATP-binding protein n=1 Tax=Kitasatospora sp. NPDC048365 TaxID=3364050 RepID=UPI0037142348